MKPTHSEIFHSLNQFTRHFSKALNETLVPLGLYSAQWAIIYLLKTNGPATQKELSSYLGVEPPTMTRTLARLENSSWITKIQGSDKREKKITLTEEALIKYEGWLHAVRTYEKGVLKNVTEEEIASLLSLIRKMNANL